MSRHLILALSTLVATSMAACRATPAAPPTPTVSENVWAAVDGRQLTRDDIEKAYRRTRDTAQTVSDEEELAAKLGLLNDLILQDLLIAKASELKVEVPSSELDTAYAEARKSITEEAYQQELTKRGLTAEDMREGLRRELLTQKVIEHEIRPKIAVTSQEVSDFFLANRSQFNLTEDAYRIAQIIVTPVRDAQVVNRHWRRCHDATGSGNQDCHADGETERRRILRRSRDGLLRRSRVGAAWW